MGSREDLVELSQCDVTTDASAPLRFMRDACPPCGCSGRVASCGVAQYDVLGVLRGDPVSFLRRGEGESLLHEQPLGGFLFSSHHGAPRWGVVDDSGVS